MKKIPKPKSKGFMKPFLALLILMITSFAGFSQGPTITGPESAPGIPAILSGGVTEGQIYKTESGMSNYVWIVSKPAGSITADDGNGSITVTWTNPTGQQSVRVTYTDASGATVSAVLFINYYPYLPAIDPEIIPQFVDPLPHFAAGLRVNAKAGGNLLIKEVPVQQVALSTGTVLQNGTIGDPLTPNAGLGNYAAYAISTDGGTTFGPAMWPAQTIEAQQGFPLTVKYQNDLFGVKYSDFNILADQTLMMKGYKLTGDPYTEPYTGDIPMVVHLHGGEMPSNSDGGPNSWFTPGYALLGPGFKDNASSLSTYPNMQEATTLWFHPHDDGLTRINVYTGLAGFYFIRGADEEAAQLPGWSGDSKVQEVTPTGKTATFNGDNTYLPEIELAIQDRMFNTKGELFWPVDPASPEFHPFWTPEFVGDVMVVNGKSWPYLSVAPRKYRFRILDGCNARFLNMWLVDANGNPGPPINVVGGEGGLLASPVVLDPAQGQALLMAPGQRYDVVIDFSGSPADATYTLMNDAGSPFPDGEPVVPELTGRIMQFVVNGIIVNENDNSALPNNLRTVTPLVKLTDFAGNLSPGVTPVVKRQLVLNEVMAASGPAAVLINNAFFDAALALPGTPAKFGGPTEIPVEGTTEVFQIINISADAHPIHIHLTQWQIVSRQAIDVAGYTNAYAAAWVPRGLPEYPLGQGYPGGSGSPYPYTNLNGEGAVGGNPAVSPFLLGPIKPAGPEEWGWKDNVIVNPGEVTTFVTRIAPTDRPIDATPDQLLFPFDPSEGPGYVWHCHIVDHEDMSMMRPLPIAPSPLRFPQITVQPAPVSTCVGSTATFSVTATKISNLPLPPKKLYQWEVSIDGGITWTPLADGGSYAGVNTSSLSIIATLGLNNNQYRVVLENFDGVTTSNAALLTVNPVTTASVSIGVSQNNVCAGMQVTFTATPVNGGTPFYQWYVNDVAVDGERLATFTYTPKNADKVKVEMTSTLLCTSLSTSNVITMVVNDLPVPTFTVQAGPTICQAAKVIYTTQPGMTNYVWKFTGVANIDYTIVLGGTALTNTVTLQWLTLGVKTVNVNYTDVNGCTAVAASEATTTVIGKALKPTIITASSPTACQGGSNIYSVPLVAGVTSYLWTYSGTGATIDTPTANSTVINFAANATSGVLSVTAFNVCGESPAQTLKVTVNPLPAQPGAFTKFTATVCKTQSKVIYTVPKVIGVTYEWTYSGTGATFFSGTTTNSVSINFLNATSGTLSVKAVNACGSSISRDLAITVNQGCVMKSAFITGEEPVVAIDSPIAENALKVYPNPTSGEVNFEFQITENARVTLDITSMTGTHIDKVFDAVVEAGEIRTVLFNQPITAGVYFYYLKWNDQMITGKFIKTE